MNAGQLTKSRKAAQSEVGTPAVHDFPRDLVNAQTRFFPAWWTYIGTPRASAPLYRVVCRNREEIELAQALEPDVVNAEYVLIDDDSDLG